MILGEMLNLDEDAVICDLAETYHILNYRGLSLKLVATLVNGLSDDSRIKMKVAKRRLTLDNALAAATVDRLTQLLWTKTEDAKRGRNKPQSILDILEHPPERHHQSFSSVEEFERRRAQIMRS